MLSISTSSGRWSALCAQIERFLEADQIRLNVDGQAVRGYRSPDSPALWIRDHSDILRGGRYFLPDVQSAVQVFADHQAASGRVFDYVTTEAGTEPENWEKWVRVPLETDVEFRFVKAAFLAWQASGDDAWARALLPSLGRALAYATSHPWRWDAEHALPKRAYTVDTWDFDYTAGRNPWLNFQVTEDTFWGLMHGDASGLYEAMLLLAQMHDALGDDSESAPLREAAEALRTRANELLFNGRFYTHFHKLVPVTVDGVDEAEQLSLSNPMAINRGMAGCDEAAAILGEYQRRRAASDSFAEWYSIDPPFPHGHFGEEKIVPGAYCNGGIMPLVGGEIARAAFEHGFEDYGLATLEQYREMVAATGETYLWYFPDGTASTVDTSTSPDAQPTDGWGASAMLFGLVEGLAGVQDLGASFRHVRLAPRWVAEGEGEAAVDVSYAASGASFGYTYAHDAASKTITLELRGEADVDLHLMLPPGTRAESVQWGGGEVDASTAHARQSAYAEARGRVDGEATVEVTYGDA